MSGGDKLKGVEVAPESERKGVCEIRSLPDTIRTSREKQKRERESDGGGGGKREVKMPN